MTKREFEDGRPVGRETADAVADLILIDGELRELGVATPVLVEIAPGTPMTIMWRMRPTTTRSCR